MVVGRDYEWVSPISNILLESDYRPRRGTLAGRSAIHAFVALKLTVVPALCVFSTWRFWEPPTHPCGLFAIKRQRPLLFLFPHFGYSQLRSQQGEGGSTDFLSTIDFQL